MKKGRNEFRRFLDISIGSLAELSYLLLCAKDLGFLPNPMEGLGRSPDTRPL